MKPTKHDEALRKFNQELAQQNIEVRTRLREANTTLIELTQLQNRLVSNLAVLRRENEERLHTVNVLRQTLRILNEYDSTPLLRRVLMRGEMRTLLRKAVKV